MSPAAAVRRCSRRPAAPPAYGLAGDVEIYTFGSKMDIHLPLDVCMAGRSSWSPGEHFERSAMFEWGVELVLGGSGVMTARGKTCELHPGDVFFFRPYEHVTYATAPRARGWQKVFLDFFPGNVAVIMQQLGLAERTYVRVSPQRLPRIRALFMRALKLARTQPRHFRSSLSTLAYQLLLALSHEALDPAHRDATPDNVVRVMTYVEQHPAHRLNIAQLAHIAGCSVRHLNRLFGRLCGMSSHAWIERTKVQRACILLTHRGDSISAIARELGYRDPLHFCKVFKRVTGQTPRGFRSQLIEPDSPA